MSFPDKHKNRRRRLVGISLHQLPLGVQRGPTYRHKGSPVDVYMGRDGVWVTYRLDPWWARTTHSMREYTRGRGASVRLLVSGSRRRRKRRWPFGGDR